MCCLLGMNEIGSINLELIFYLRAGSIDMVGAGLHIRHRAIMGII